MKKSSLAAAACLLAVSLAGCSNSAVTDQVNELATKVEGQATDLAQLSDIKQSVSDQAAQLAELAESLAGTDALKENITVLQNEAVKSAEQITSLEKLVSELSGKLEDSQAEVADLTEKLTQAESQIAQLTAAFEKMAEEANVEWVPQISG